MTPLQKQLTNTIDNIARNTEHKFPYGYGDANDYRQDAMVKVLEVEKCGYIPKGTPETGYVRYLSKAVKTAIDESSNKYNSDLSASPVTAYYIRGIQNNPDLSDKELSTKYKITESRVRKLRNSLLNTYEPIHEDIICPTGQKIKINEYIDRELLSHDQLVVLDYFLEGYDLPNISVKLKREPKEIKKIYSSLIDSLREQNKVLLEDINGS